MKKPLTLILAFGIFNAYANTPSFNTPQDGVTYYQKDFNAAIAAKNYQKALVDTYVLQDYLAQIYMANPE
jgi:ABC-type spermidine/putrescine transport system permease subunit I